MKHLMWPMQSSAHPGRNHQLGGQLCYLSLEQYVVGKGDPLQHSWCPSYLRFWGQAVGGRAPVELALAWHPSSTLGAWWQRVSVENHLRPQEILAKFFNGEYHYQFLFLRGGVVYLGLIETLTCTVDHEWKTPMAWFDNERRYQSLVYSIKSLNTLVSKQKGGLHLLEP